MHPLPHYVLFDHLPLRADDTEEIISWTQHILKEIHKQSGSTSITFNHFDWWTIIFGNVRTAVSFILLLCLPHCLSVSNLRL